MTDWFRSWHGAPTDNKWILIGRRAGVAPGVVSAIFWALLDHASQHVTRGNADDFDVETYAAFSGFSEEDIQSVLRELRAKDVIVDDKLAGWEKRQPRREDVSNQRVREHREKKRAQHVTQCNADVSGDTDDDRSRLLRQGPGSERIKSDELAALQGAECLSVRLTAGISLHVRP
ncbi:hypothetical protein [Chelatococcus sp. YT9]|uniref:hypothetical protein n=1 Tax=Chelatococcus sp. YT9 TaxID=2835635 RepID=UPI001BCD1B72|nr:hypothetical protein [Chelatococcus sp. YT9]MBS7698594.1 hypothetical protein [Chelatococcus sp. YT9]